jgi:plastocyanin domain-containing protein
MNNSTITSTIIAIAFVAGAIFLVNAGLAQNIGQNTSVNNVSIVEGKQIIEINAKGGYFPHVSSAKADLTTIIRMKTSNTFDCSSYLVIPSVGFRGSLPQTGAIDIPIPPQKSGSVIQGLCGMGMYNFQIKFE